MDNQYQGYLIGWKNIGRYFGRSQRTVQRWEQKEGLPVLRDPSGRPLASPEHIHEWLLKFNDEYFSHLPGVNAALEIESQENQKQREFQERMIHAQRLNRGRY